MTSFCMIQNAAAAKGHVKLRRIPWSTINGQVVCAYPIIVHSMIACLKATIVKGCSNEQLQIVLQKKSASAECYISLIDLNIIIQRENISSLCMNDLSFLYSFPEKNGNLEHIQSNVSSHSGLFRFLFHRSRYAVETT